jgi:hypothetical protein
MTFAAHVSSAYAHYPKQAVPRGLIETGAAGWKLYDLEKPGEPVSETIAGSARALLERNLDGEAGLDGDIGFAILHRCGADFYFLLLSAWRGSNEAWEAVWYRDGGMPGFAPFSPAYPAEAGTFRPTFCVWELAVVAHEALAWARFLASPRGADDLARWREDWFSGAA